MPEIENPREPRELTLVQKFWDGGQGIKNYAPNVQRVEDEPAAEEVAEAEEAMTPAPKDSSAPESATSEGTPPPVAPPRSESPVPPLPSHTTDQSVADRVSGKDSDESVVEPQTEKETTSGTDDSSPSSSTPTSPGSSTPPAPVKPPTVAPPPVAPTTQQ